MFLKQITLSNNIKFVYHNTDDSLNTITVAGMKSEITNKLLNIADLYSQYLQERVGFCEISIDSKNKTNVCTATVLMRINGFLGIFSFAHSLVVTSAKELRKLEEQELFEACQEYRMLNDIYSAILELSSFLKENLLQIQGVNTEQLELFVKHA